MASKKKTTIPERPRVPKGKKLLQIPLDEDLHYMFKIHAATKRTTMANLIVGCVEDMVGEKSARQERK